MFSSQFILFVASCVVVASASPITKVDLYEPHQAVLDYDYNPVLLRSARSAQGGSLDLGYKHDQLGREASLQYNHNIYSNSDGRGSVDAYAKGSRNFDYNRNDFAGGIVGSWKF